MKALKLKFACGSSGYKELLNQGHPLPSERILTRKMEHMKFEPGLIDEVFQFLSMKVIYFEEIDKDCVLFLDEMAITSGIVFNNSTNCFLGHVTLPLDIQRRACQALVIMLAGIGSRWKQIVAYHFTDKSLSGELLSKVILNVIQRAEQLGLRVHSVTSDMGAGNQRMWKFFNINADRYCKVSNFCEHPCDKKRKLWFFSDVPHAFKNVKSGFLNNKFFKIPESFVIKYNLPTNIITLHLFKELISYQKDLEFMLTPNLEDKYLDDKNNFLKMRVSSATNVFNHDVSAAFKFMSEEHNNNEYKTASWFVGYVSRWFKLMTVRHPSLALGKRNLAKYEETTSFLKESNAFFTELQVGENNSWKPFQKSCAISTTSLLEISTYLLNERQFQFCKRQIFSRLY